MIDWGMLFVLISAVAIGYWLGRRSVSVPEESELSSLEPHYIQGLNYLLNEQPDAAIETFVDALEVNSETLETHLALGNLLRKRGEVGRAIKIHQNLLARPGLAGAHSEQVQLELARDYMTSGLLDRAEVLLRELVEVAGATTRTQCIEYLIEIFRDEKEWLKGVEAINQLSTRRFSRLPQEWRFVQGHFFCELAEEALSHSDYMVARRHLKAAMAADKESVRASLLQADLDYRLGQHREAVRALKQVFYQDPLMLVEALPLMELCYRVQGRLPQWRQYLNDLLEQGASTSVILALADVVAHEEGEAKAAKFIAKQIADSPSLKSVGCMLSLQLAEPGPSHAGVVMADRVITSLQKQTPQYRCHSCGFSGQQMHWLCPGCKAWGSVKPVD